MTDITELAQRTDLLMDNALETAKQLRELSESPVAEAIFEPIVENENGKEIQFERPISDLAYTAFLKLERLVEALEARDKRIAEQRKYFEGVIADGGKRIAELESRAESAEQRNAELEAKLANPVLLPKTNGYWTEQEKAYEEAITFAKRQVRLAGFRCEEDE